MTGAGLAGNTTISSKAARLKGKTRALSCSIGDETESLRMKRSGA